MTKNLKVSDKKLLVVLPEANKNVYLSARNIEGANDTILQYVNFINDKPIGRIKYALN